MKKLLFFIICIAFAFLACGAPARSVEPSGESSAGTMPTMLVGSALPEGDFDPMDYPVALIMPQYSHPVHRMAQLGFLEAAEQLGYTNAEVIGVQETSVSALCAEAEAFAAKGGKGILLWTGNIAIQATVARLAAQDVTMGVLGFDHRIDDAGALPKGLAFNIAYDPAASGEQAAKLLAGALNGRRGSVLVALEADDATGRAIASGFRAGWEALAEDGTLNNIVLLDAEAAGGSLQTARESVAELRAMHTDLIGVFTTSIYGPEAWTAEEVGSLAVIGLDATKDNLELLEQGKLLALIARPLYDEAYAGMEALDGLLRGERTGGWTALEAQPVTLDGLDENGVAYYAALAEKADQMFSR